LHPGLFEALQDFDKDLVLLHIVFSDVAKGSL